VAGYLSPKVIFRNWNHRENQKLEPQMTQITQRKQEIGTTDFTD
jgi:hypothetical protein